MGPSRVGLFAALLMGALLSASGAAQAEKKFCLTVGSDMGQRYCGMAERDCRMAATGGTGGFCVEDTSSSDSSASAPKTRKKKTQQ